MSAHTNSRLAAQLDPETSRRLFLVVDEARAALGWLRQKLASQAKLSEDVLNTWAYKVRHEQPIRIELEKALSLLAAIGTASNRVDELWFELSNAVAGLVDLAEETTRAVS